MKYNREGGTLWKAAKAGRVKAEGEWSAVKGRGKKKGLTFNVQAMVMNVLSLCHKQRVGVATKRIILRLEWKYFKPVQREKERVHGNEIYNN